MKVNVTSTKQGNLDAVQGAVMSEMQQEARGIIEEAHAKAADYRSQVKEETQAKVEKIINQAHEQADLQREQAAAQARLDAQHLKLRHREQLLDKVFEMVMTRLNEILERDDYPDLVYRLTHEAINRLAGVQQTLEIHADEETQLVLDEILDKLRNEMDVALEEGEPLQNGHGIVVQTQDGHRRYDNRLETRLARLKDELRSPVYHILKGEVAGE